MCGASTESGYMMIMMPPAAADADAEAAANVDEDW